MTELEKLIEEQTAELQRERNFVSAILDTAGALIVVLDKEGRIMRFNRACEELTGYTFEEVKGSYIWDLFLVPEEVIPIKSTFEDLKHGKFPNEHENYWITGSGKRLLIKWASTALLDNDGRVEFGIWIGIDITERRRMMQELEDSEERYRALIENVKDGVGLIQNQSLLFVNNAFVSMFDYNGADEVIGMNPIRLIAVDFKSRFSELLATAMDKRSWGVAFRGKCLSKTGREFWAEILSSVISRKGKPEILLTVRDITENMLWEQTMKQEAEYFRSETVRLKSSIGERYRLGKLIGKSSAMQQVYEMILQAASTDANVILSGKSGTGKELAARAIHDMSPRAEKPFIPVNCGAIPESLIESEFFGYKKGAFTGAATDKQGFLYAAHTGTLFLDEIGDIGLNMQVKLLRALEDGSFIPVGSSRPQNADIRIIAATNKDLSDMVKKGLMREDFFYRISVIPIMMPPLKDRKEDIPLLVEHFLQRYGSDLKTLPVKVMDALMNYDWPGNVRELQNVLQRYLTVKSLDFMKIDREGIKGVKSSAHPEPLLSSSEKSPFNRIPEKPFSLEKTLDDTERQLLIRTLDACRWNRTKAAAMMEISRRALFRRMKRLGIE